MAKPAHDGAVTPKKHTAKKAAPKRPRGRPTLYTVERGKSICERLATGEPLTAICETVGMPAVRTVSLWKETHKEFAAAFARARADGFDALAEQCLVIANTPVDGVEITTDDKGGVTEKRGDMLGHRKLQIETRLKLLAKWDPKRYGDLQKVEHSGSVDVAATLMAARKRAGV